MSSIPKLSIDLAPTPGFCIKSTVVNPTTLYPPRDSLVSERLLEPTAPISVPAGRKIFVNICFDQNVPPPPPADEETIKRAMNPHEHNEEVYYVPVVVSQPREDKDKGWLTDPLFPRLSLLSLSCRGFLQSHAHVHVRLWRPTLCLSLFYVYVFSQRPKI